MHQYELLRKTNFGSSIAEEEQAHLKHYFVQTHLWTEVREGQIDIILGDKGSGKSAIFLLLREDQLDMTARRNIYLVAAENPRGDAAFKNLVEDPPADEREIEIVWRVYFLVLIAKFLESRKPDHQDYHKLFRALVNAGLMDHPLSSLGSILWSVRRVVSQIRSIGFSFTIDPNTMAPVILPEIRLKTTNDRFNMIGIQLSELYKMAEKVLSDKSMSIWILLDRLDIAFESSLELERNALRALLRTYASLHSYPHIKLKIFLRSDLFERITHGGFREASHIIPKATELSWDRDGILDVIARRALNNKALVEFYMVDADAVKKNIAEKQSLVDRMLPREIENVPTLDWILQNLVDGKGRYCPRDVIQFLIELKQLQIGAIERGRSAPEGKVLFAPYLFKEAYRAVSETRCKTVLYAEYPDEREYVDALRTAKTELSMSALAHLWGVDEDEASGIAKRLMRIGVFKERHKLTRGNFEVSPLYAPALDLVANEHKN